jgi:hypothetical protein
MTQIRSFRPSAHTPAAHTPAAPTPAGGAATAEGSVLDAHSPTGQAYRLLRTVFTIAPIAFGADKFAELLTHWESYLAPWVNDLVPGTAHQAMLAVGVIEIVAGLLVAVRPDLGGYVVAAWLAGIILNLVTMGDYLDVALRDFGLLVAALALARLAQAARSAGGSTARRTAATRAGAR